jgi:hypothetical protein
VVAPGDQDEPTEPAPAPPDDWEELVRHYGLPSDARAWRVVRRSDGNRLVLFRFQPFSTRQADYRDT